MEGRRLTPPPAGAQQLVDDRESRGFVIEQVPSYMDQSEDESPAESVACFGFCSGLSLVDGWRKLVLHSGGTLICVWSDSHLIDL